MKIIPNLLKDRYDEQLVNTTVAINQINPMIDRIIDDDSVESVIMINNEGEPIFTNVPVLNATNLGRVLFPLGNSVRMAVKDLDVLDETMVVRINTKNCEIMMVPREDFAVVVVQHSRSKSRKKMTKKLK